MEKLADEGLCRSIGVSNFLAGHLRELLERCRISPAVNQIELSPYNYLYRKDTVDLCREHGICIEAYSPLTKGRRLNDAVLVEIASEMKKTPAQILIRWCLDQEFVVIPKSTHRKRIIENANVFDFSLSNEIMERLNSLNENFVTGWDPTDIP